MTVTPAASEPLVAAVAEWKHASDLVLDVARAAAPVTQQDFRSMLFRLAPTPGAEAIEEELGGEAALNQHVDAWLAHSENVLALLSQNAHEGRPMAVQEASVPIVLAALELSQNLTAASQEPRLALRAMGLDDRGAPRLAVSRAVIDEFGAAALGQAPVPPVELPKDLVDKLEALENAGGKEVWDVARDATLAAALKTCLDKGISHGGDDVQRVYEDVKKAAGWIKGVTIKLLRWVIEKLRGLLPEKFKGAFDEKVKELEDKLAEGAQGLLGDALGEIFGRRGAAQAWRDEEQAGKDLSAAEAKLPDVIAGQIKWIGYVERTRKNASSVATILRGAAGLAGLTAQLEVILGALAVSLVAVTCFEVWDGFNDIEALATAG